MARNEWTKAGVACNARTAGLAGERGRSILRSRIASARAYWNVLVVRFMISFLVLFVCGSGVGVAQDEQEPATSDPIAEQKAKIDYYNAHLTYLNAAVPSSGLSGTVTTKDNAGLMEGNAMAAAAMRIAAGRVVSQTRSALALETGRTVPTNVVLLTSVEKVDISSVGLFERQVSYVAHLLTEAGASGCSTDKSDGVQRVQTMGVESVAPALVFNVLSWFKADYEIGGTVITPDELLFVQALAHEAKPYKDSWRVLLPTQLPSGQGVVAIDASIGALACMAQQVEYTAAEKEEEVPKGASADKETRIKEKNAKIKKAKDAMAAYQEFLAALASAPDKSPLSLGLVLKQAAVWYAMGPNGYALIAHVQSSTGSHYSKKTLWTYFGTMPFFVSGGTVVGYTLIKRQSSAAVDADVVAVSCAYVKANQLVGDKKKKFNCDVVSDNAESPKP